MTPTGDFQAAPLLQHRPHVALVGRHLCKAQQHIYLCYSRSGGHQLRVKDAQLAQHIGINTALHFLDALLCTQDARLVYFEFGRRVALDVGQCLPALVVFGNQVLVDFGFTDFDIVTKNLVKAHFECFDAAALALASFERDHPTLRVTDRSDEFVKLGMEACAYHTAIVFLLAAGDGQSLPDEFDHLRAWIKLFGDSH